MSSEIKCKSCNGTGQVLVESDGSMVDRMARCPECQGTGTAPISPYACDKCRDTGWKEIPETAHESADMVTCDCEKGKKLLDDKRVNAAFQRMFRAERERLKAKNFAENYQAGPGKFVDPFTKMAAVASELEQMDATHLTELDEGATHVRALEGFTESISDIVDLDACRRDINPNGVHVLVRDRLVALETQDMSVSFEEQMQLDLPPQITILEKFPPEVMGQLLMNELNPDGMISKGTIHYWLDVFEFMGPDYFNALKRLVAKLEWTV